MNQKINEFLRKAAEAYYAGSPIISDAQFDALAKSNNFTEVGAKEYKNTAKHYHRLYSLQKFYEDEGKKKPLEGVSSISASIKLDGAAISLLYLDGHLTQALTRGDGIEGQIITDKILASKNLVPLYIEDAPPILQVTGEIVAPVNIENARNYAAGALNLKSTEEFATRVLSFIAYGVYPYITKSHHSDMDWLYARKFGTCKEPNLLLKSVSIMKKLLPGLPRY